MSCTSSLHTYHAAGAYKQLLGTYKHGQPTFMLAVDYVQGDAYASPSKVRVEMPWQETGFPDAYLTSDVAKIALCDFVTRVTADFIRTKHLDCNIGDGNGGWSSPKGTRPLSKSNVNRLTLCNRRSIQHQCLWPGGPPSNECHHYRRQNRITLYNDLTSSGKDNLGPASMADPGRQSFTAGRNILAACESQPAKATAACLLCRTSARTTKPIEATWVDRFHCQWIDTTESFGCIIASDVKCRALSITEDF